MNIEKLTNEELNKLAHEAMGECWHQANVADNGEIGRCVKCDKNLQFTAYPPQLFYSTELTDAFKLIDFARAKWRTDDNEETFWQMTDCQEYGWRVDVMWSHHDGDVSIFEANGETLPIAIVKAFISTFGKGEK